MYDYNGYAIGADIGGSHITAAAVDIKCGKVIENTTITCPINNKAHADEIIGKWGDTLRKVIGLTDISKLKGIGVAMPGPFDYEKGIAWFGGETQKYENLHGLNVGNTLTEYLNLSDPVPVRFINDATAFAIGEEWIGRARGTFRSLSITLGTGIGSGFVEKGLPLTSSPDIPENGYIYNLQYKDGIADDYFSTRGLVKAYEDLKGEPIAGVKEIAIIAENDPEVHKLMQRFGTELALLLIPVLQKFKPEVVVVGGNISKAFKLFGPSMEEAIKDNGLSIGVKNSDLCDDAQIVGAARIIDSEYYRLL